MAVTLGETEDITWYDARINSIEKNFEKEYWQGNRYGSKKKLIEERVSALAIISGLAKKEHYNILVDSVLVPVKKSSPHMDVDQIAARADKEVNVYLEKVMSGTTHKDYSNKYKKKLNYN